MNSRLEGNQSKGLLSIDIVIAIKINGAQDSDKRLVKDEYRENNEKHHWHNDI